MGNRQPARGVFHAIAQFDRRRFVEFVRFTAKRFVDDNCLQSAGALAYTSLFAMVPLTAVMLALLSQFPAFADWRERISHFVFENFVPAAGDVVQRYLTEFADNASKATAIGIVVLVISAVMLMLSVESAFNRIWRVPTNRPARTRFVLYWAVLTLVPLLLVATLAVTSYLLALSALHSPDLEFSIKHQLLTFLPFLIEWTTLTAAYVLIPNRSVRLRDALLGALVAALLFELAKRGFATYVTTGANYQQVYGALAIVPVFILWVYLCWVLVLLGASLTAIIAAFEYKPAALRLRPGEELLGLIRVLAHFADAQRSGAGLHGVQLRRSEPFLTDDLLQDFLADLVRADMIQRNENDEWVLTRNLAAVTLYDIYVASGYRLPTNNSLPAPGTVTGDKLAVELLEHGAQDVRKRLGVPLSEIFPASRRSDQPNPEKNHPVESN